MVSVFTPNLNLEEPARGDQIGVWDTPVNSNMSVLDGVYGATTTIVLNNANVTLSAAQYQCQYIVFTGTLTASVVITFPSIGSQHTIENRTGGAFTVTLATTTVGAEAVCCPPYEPFDVLTRSASAGVRYRNLGRVGSYWDYAGSSVPIWVSGCTIPPYLACDGTAFSSATYPALATLLGVTTLPDAQGRVRATLNGGTGRITSGSSTGGVDGNTLFAAGGSQTNLLVNANVPLITVTDPGHTHGAVGSDGSVGTTHYQVTGSNQNRTVTGAAILSDFTGITAGNASPTNFSNLPPAYIGGISLIRAA